MQRRVSALPMVALGVALAIGSTESHGQPSAPADAAPTRTKAQCPDEMAVVGTACIDRWEASVVEVDDAGKVLRDHPPNEPVLTKKVAAQSVRGVIPQAHISRDEAEQACNASGKRLCAKDEWMAACQGPTSSIYPYGSRRRAGACNDKGAEPLREVFARPDASTLWGFETMNDPRLLLVPNGVARTGRYERCKSEVGAFDMVGNLHEWTNEADGTFRGGYFLDTTHLGTGCEYRATGHNAKYRDYSTGFRCCKSV